jgi:hypothetical protein
VNEEATAGYIAPLQKKKHKPAWRGLGCDAQTPENRGSSRRSTSRHALAARPHCSLVGIMKRTGKSESRPCKGMYPLHAPAEPFLFVAASLSERTAQRGLAWHQVRDTKRAPRRISYMKAVSSTCLCYCSPRNYERQHVQERHDSAFQPPPQKNLTSPPSSQRENHNTRHPSSQQLTGSSRAPRP